MAENEIISKSKKEIIMGEGDIHASTTDYFYVF